MPPSLRPNGSQCARIESEVPEYEIVAEQSDWMPIGRIPVYDTRIIGSDFINVECVNCRVQVVNLLLYCIVCLEPLGLVDD